MRFSRRSKVGILLSAITILTLVSAFVVTLATHGAASQAATTSSGVTYHGKSLAGTRTATASGLPTHVTNPAHPRTAPLDVDSLNPGDKGALKHAAAQSGLHLPIAKRNAISAPEGSLISNFNGVSDTANDQLNSFEVTPPDQGLCVGVISGQTVVVEPVNLVVAIYTQGGHLIAAESLFTLFQDPNAIGDVRCFYDRQSQAFFFTEIGVDPTGTHTVDDVAVLDSNGFAVYQFDSSLGGTCFGDQPHVGYNSNTFYISTDEFCGAGFNTYSGAILIAISKPQLLSEVASPNAVLFGPLALGGVPILTLQPAVSPYLLNEYLLNSFPFDQFGNNNNIANTLGFWKVTGGENITTGHGTATLTGTIISSETYAFPQLAASTGTGATSTVCVPPGSKNCLTVTSEAFLNPDDSRMQQVQAINNNGDTDLYAALPTALNIPGDPSARDGAAWFKIDAESGSVEAQGYVAAAGSYLLYPAIYHTSEGTTAMVFTITSPTLNPSAAYTVMPSTGTNFGPIKIGALGAGPHISFSDTLVNGRPRWGDYSAAVVGPNGGNLWLATEYIPPAASQAPFDNWGTRVFEVAGDL